MKQHRRCQRCFIVSLLLVSVVSPILLLSSKLGNLSSSSERDEFVNDISAIRQSSDALKLKSIEKDEGEGLKEPERLVLEDRGVFTDPERDVIGDLSMKGMVLEDRGVFTDPERDVIGDLSMKGKEDKSDGGSQNKIGGVGVPLLWNSPRNVEKNKPNHTTDEGSSQYSRINHATVDIKITEIRDQLIMANAFLQFAPPNSNSHFVRELKLRIREMERVLSHANKDKELSRSALQRKRAMKVSLEKARRLYPNCAAMETKLRAMAFDSEEQLRAQKNQVSYLVQLAARTFPKGLHCLSMRLTAEYFTLPLEERELSNKKRVRQPNLHHYVIFSDNLLACAVVVNSAISTSMDPMKIVFHVVTDALNYPAMTMWFLLHPPSQAAIHILSMDDFNWLPFAYISSVKQLGVKDPRFSSVLNHLRFYLPMIFPYLDKVLLLDHDVVVQRDLSELWKCDMKGKVNGAVEMCRKGESFFTLKDFVDFTDLTIAKRFDPRACTWAFGMNIFDLQQWRKLRLTAVYQKWLQHMKVKERPLVRAGTLPLGQVIFYNHTLVLDKQWHLLGLGYNSDLSNTEIEQAAVIHYDGNMKPWLETGIPIYKGHWNRFLNYEHPYLQQCNIHE